MAIPASPRCGCQGRGGARHCRQGRPAGRNGLVALLDSYFARHRSPDPGRRRRRASTAISS